MTDVSRLLTVRHALHSDSSTFTGTPGTLFPLRCTDDVAGLYPRNRVALARNLRSQSGRRYSHAQGVQDVAEETSAPNAMRPGPSSMSGERPKPRWSNVMTG